MPGTVYQKREQKKSAERLIFYLTMCGKIELGIEKETLFPDATRSIPVERVVCYLGGQDLNSPSKLDTALAKYKPILAGRIPPIGCKLCWALDELKTRYE